MAQAREGAEDEGIPVDACPIVGEPDIHDSLQFRSREVATFRVLRPDVETCERIGGNPAVLIRRVGHQLQFLDSRMDRPGTHPLYRGEVDYKLFDEIPLQLFERNIFYTVFVFEERGKPVTAFAVIVIARPGSKTLYRGEVDDELFHELPLQLFERNILDVVFVFEERGKAVTAFAVIVIARIGAVFAHTFEEPCKVFVEGLQQQAAVVAHTEEGVADFFGRNIRITVAEPLVLLADIGLDIFQFFIETLSFKTSAGGFVGFGIPKGGANGEFAAELRHRTINRDTTHDGNLTMFFRLPFHVEKDFESAALHDNLNFVDLLNVKSGYLLCGNPTQ